MFALARMRTATTVSAVDNQVATVMDGDGRWRTVEDSGGGQWRTVEDGGGRWRQWILIAFH